MCGENAKFQRWQDKTFVSAAGAIRVSRAYYYCPHCHQGGCPWEKQLGLRSAEMTPGASELTCLAGILTSFEEASAKVLPKMAGLRVSASTVQRITEGTGGDLKQRLENGETFGPQTPWDWHADARGQRCAYVSLDATGIGQQGPGGSKVEGRMAYVGMIFNPRTRPGETGQARYLAGLYELKELGAQMRRQGAQVGMDDADCWIGLTDGGNGLEEFLRVQFPRAECILDFYHAAEHLNDLAKAWHANEAEANTVAQRWCHQLKHEGGSVVVATLEALDLRGRSASTRARHRQVVQYLRNNEHRMDYPRYQANGWLIGSGHIESACKTVVGGRLKGSGMRWGEAGSDTVCHLRALFKSEPQQWATYWQPSLN